MAITSAGVERVSAIFTERFERGLAPGSFWAVFDENGVVASEGLGDRGDGRPADLDTVFRIASCTKSFTAATLLTLVEEGVLALDDEVIEYLPSLRVTGTFASAPAITIRMLLSMSAGFPTDDPWADRCEAMSTDAFDEMIASGVRVSATPGTGFQYSNLGFAIAGRIIEHVTGERFIDVVRERILDPLALADTAFSADHYDQSRLAGEFRRADGEWLRVHSGTPGSFSPIGGLFSTAPDIARWADWLQSAFHPAREGHESGVLSAASRILMQQGTRLIPADYADGARPGERLPDGYGLGLRIAQSPTLGSFIGHTGGYPGLSAHMRWNPERSVGIIAFENASYAGVAAPALDACIALAEAAGREEVVLWPETSAAVELIRSAIAGGDLTVLPERILSPNVEMDAPLAERTRRLAELVGSPEEARQGIVHISRPSEAVWDITRAGRTVATVTVKMTPEAEPRVQWIGIAQK